MRAKVADQKTVRRVQKSRMNNFFSYATRRGAASQLCLGAHSARDEHPRC